MIASVLALTLGALAFGTAAGSSRAASSENNDESAKTESDDSQATAGRASDAPAIDLDSISWAEADPSTARLRFRKQTDEDPRNPRAWYGFATALYNLGDSTALDAYERYAFLCMETRRCEPALSRSVREKLRSPTLYVLWPRILLRWRLIHFVFGAD